MGLVKPKFWLSMTHHFPFSKSRSRPLFQLKKFMNLTPAQERSQRYTFYVKSCPSLQIKLMCFQYIFYSKNINKLFVFVIKVFHNVNILLVFFLEQITKIFHVYRITCTPVFNVSLTINFQMYSRQLLIRYFDALSLKSFHKIR